MKAFKNLAQRGSVRRVVEIDESSNTWKLKAGRADGPDTYVHGDLCNSVLRQAHAMSARERDEIYGGSVLLVAALEARDLIAADSNGLSDPYLTFVMVDEDGKELDAEKQRTRVIPESLDPDWDEVFAFGQKVHLEDAAFLRVKVKDYDTPLKSDNLGRMDIPLDLIKSNSDVTLTADGRWDAVLDIEPASSMRQKVGSLGKLHLQFLYHAPPPDPQPLSVAVRIVEARDLISADSNGFSDPFMKVKPLTRTGKHIKDRKGKDVELRSTTKTKTLNPDYNEILVFNDTCLGENINDLAHVWAQPWGVASLAPSGLASMPVTQVSCGLEKASSILVVLKDYDFGKADDDLGEVSIPFSTLFGDEDAVISGDTMRVDKWFRVRPHKGMKLDDGQDADTAHLGMLHLDIVMRFDEELLAPGWVEAVDADSGAVYWYNSETGKAQWSHPNASSNNSLTKQASLSSISETEGGDAGAAAAGEQTDTMGGDKEHKPPKPLVAPPEIEASPTGVDRTASPSPTAASNEAEIEACGPDAEVEADATAAPASKTKKTTAATAVEADDDAPVEEAKPKSKSNKAAVVVEEVEAPAAEPKKPAAAPVPAVAAPAPAPVKPSTAKPAKAAAPADDDAEGDDDEGGEPVGADIDAINAAAQFAGGGLGKKDAIIVPGLDNALASAAASLGNVSGGDRDKLFFETMRKNAAEKRKAEEDAKKSKMASMTDEERAEYEKEQAAEARRAARKEKMLSTHMTAYSSSGAAAALKGGRGGSRGGRGGRGRGRGGAAA